MRTNCSQRTIRTDHNSIQRDRNKSDPSQSQAFHHSGITTTTMGSLTQKKDSHSSRRHITEAKTLHPRARHHNSTRRCNFDFISLNFRYSCFPSTFSTTPTFCPPLSPPTPSCLCCHKQRNLQLCRELFVTTSESSQQKSLRQHFRQLIAAAENSLFHDTTCHHT